MFISQNLPEEILCLECRQFNPPGNEKCLKCGAGLLLLPEEPPKLENIFHKIAEKTGDFAEDRLTQKQYWDFLVNRQVFYEKCLRDAEDLAIPPELEQEVQEELQAGISGLKYLLQGIKILKEYCETRKTELSAQGLGMIRSGNELLNQALLLNWKSFITWKKTAEEFLSQQQRNI